MIRTTVLRGNPVSSEAVRASSSAGRVRFVTMSAPGTRRVGVDVSTHHANDTPRGRIRA
jgi:hypothetical protein